MYSPLVPDCGSGDVDGAGTHPAANNPATRTKAARMEDMVEEKVEALI
jgi:hypothetical protein